MIYKVGILGASGKMGLNLCGLLADDFSHKGEHLELADAVSFSKKITSIEGVEVRTLKEPPREPVHVWIDFSRPEGTVELLKQIDTPVVVATTGFEPAQMEQVKSYAKKHPVLLAANTSPGMNLVYSILRTMPIPDWTTDILLEEEHHRHKKDAPSGTAKEMLKVLKERGIDNVQVHAMRGGATPGIHTVRFMGDFEEISITHKVSDRKVFAQGALVAALSLLKIKEPGLYTMKDLFKEQP